MRDAVTVVPERVREAMERARKERFELSCETDVGRLLAVLSAGVPVGGRIIELGTGAGVGLAWIVHGVGERQDVEVWSVEREPSLVALTAQADLPAFVRLIVADAVDVVGQHPGHFDLVFADAQGGKWTGLEKSIGALRAGGVLLVDDMAPKSWDSDDYREKIAQVRTGILTAPELVSVEMSWASGVIIATRRAVDA